MKSTSINSDFFVTGFCSCKACIHAVPGNKCKRSGAYVQDVRYADFAGAKIGDAAKAGPSEAALGLTEKDN